MFNPWKHLVLASAVVLFIAQMAVSPILMALGFMLLLTGLAGGVDRLQREMEIVQKKLGLDKENKNGSDTETPKVD